MKQAQHSNDTTTRSFWKRSVQVALLTTSCLFSKVYAYSTPATTDPGYELYDIFINKGLEGPVGFVVGAWLLANAGFKIGENPKVAVLSAMGGGLLIKAESVAKALGWMI